MMRNTWIGLAIIFFGGYTLYDDDVLEALLYFSVGLGFTLMGIVKDPRFEAYKKILNIVSWIFVLSGVLLFIAVLRRDAYGS
ncbi:MAG: hypothetical protein IH947_07725 [Bacteroidetes bacterium]|nr:hypothetical protein [Bacteroidota bacterium]